jgi:ribosomal protein L6P/L9E
MILKKEITVIKSQKISINFCLLNNTKIILLPIRLNTFKYFCLPLKISIEKKNNAIFFTSNQKDEQILRFCINAFSNFLLSLEKTFHQKLILKGLGLRITKVSDLDNKILFKFKLGFSHLIDFPFSTNKFEVILKKNTIHVKGHDSSLIGNFCKQIKLLKEPNIYNGKGFWYKNEKIKYKILKKK